MKATKFDAVSTEDYYMTVNKCPVGFNMPFALQPIVDDKGNEHAHESLPPYHRRKAFLVDEWPACPTDWLRSTGRIKSYFVAIQEGKGMWLDFNATSALNHHAAVVVSVQGVNAVTGLRIKDGARLEQYIDKCPRHNKDFGPDRLCKDCGYRWPKQSYLASTAQTNNTMWLDGFRAENGVIRQYTLTSSKIHGVAANIVGEDRVFALGISFFLSKEPRPATRSASRTLSFASMSDDHGLVGYDGPVASASCGPSWTSSLMEREMDTCCLEDRGDSKGMSCDPGESGPAGHPGVPLGSSSEHPGVPLKSIDFSSVKTSMANATSHNSRSYGGKLMGGATKSSMKLSGRVTRSIVEVKTDVAVAPPSAAFFAGAEATLAAAAPAAPRAPISPVTVKKMEIGAGARVDQEIADDPNPLTFWNDEPEGLIVINYCTEEEAERIFAGGKIDVSGDKEGFMKHIPKTKVQAEA